MRTAKDFTCSGCGRKDLVLARGNRSSPIMIIGEFPGDDEIQQGKPFVGGAGRVLKSELGKQGFSLHSALITNLWLHPKNDNEDCFNNGLERLLKQAKGKELVLLLGSDTVEFFTDYSVMQVAGLIVDSPYFSCKVMACPNPAQAFYGTIGELRLSLQKFIQEAKKI